MTEREWRGNCQGERVALLVLAVVSRHGKFCIENPDASHYFDTRYCAAIRERCVWHEHVFDQCCLGLRPPDVGDDLHTRKRARFLTNLDGGETLRRSCKGPRGGRRHAHAWGTTRDSDGRWVNRARLAGAYPVVIINWVQYLGPPGPFSFPDSWDLLEVLGGLSWQRERPQEGSPRVREDPLGTPPFSLSAKEVLREPRGGPKNLGRRRVPEIRDTEPS